jgi:hypothetical protein
MSALIVEATHPRCDARVARELRAYPQRKEGTWHIITKLSSVSIPRSCVMR